METKSGLVQGASRKNVSKPNSGVSTRAYVMKVEDDVDLPELMTDLLLLSFNECDAILGLNWLTRHNAMAEFHTRGVRLKTTKGKEVLMPSIQTGLTNIIISVVSVRKMIVNGADDYLTYIMDSFESRKEINQVFVVREFLKELPRVAPEREVEFSIELEPGIVPIYLQNGLVRT
ncbi:uncharacterized protein [Gossypium hirsutum]|uniref:Uncharacterized protein n=1 Tax=Gossypium hirsutum TaxID=3635 RepID=A0ABM3BJC1_GOSHI|nr:uncharacterized protein LOC121228086 [Gossypium hirsutum]